MTGTTNPVALTDQKKVEEAHKHLRGSMEKAIAERDEADKALDAIYTELGGVDASGNMD